MRIYNAGAVSITSTMSIAGEHYQKSILNVQKSDCLLLEMLHLQCKNRNQFYTQVSL